MLGYNYKTQFNFFSINPISASVLDLYQIQQILRNPLKSFNPTHGIGRIVYVHDHTQVQMNITLNTINTEQKAIFIKPFYKVVYDQTYINRESSEVKC